jgi:hypothetical protein
MWGPAGDRWEIHRTDDQLDRARSSKDERLFIARHGSKIKCIYLHIIEWHDVGSDSYDNNICHRL